MSVPRWNTQTLLSKLKEPKWLPSATVLLRAWRSQATGFVFARTHPDLAMESNKWLHTRLIHIPSSFDAKCRMIEQEIANCDHLSLWRSFVEQPRFHLIAIGVDHISAATSTLWRPPNHQRSSGQPIAKYTHSPRGLPSPPNPRLPCPCPGDLSSCSTWFKYGTLY